MNAAIMNAACKFRSYRTKYIQAIHDLLDIDSQVLQLGLILHTIYMLTVLAATLPDYMQAVARPYAMPVTQQAAGLTGEQRLGMMQLCQTDISRPK